MPPTFQQPAHELGVPYNPNLISLDVVAPCAHLVTHRTLTRLDFFAARNNDHVSVLVPLYPLARRGLENVTETGKTMLARRFELTALRPLPDLPHDANRANAIVPITDDHLAHVHLVFNPGNPARVSAGRTNGFTRGRLEGDWAVASAVARASEAGSVKRVVRRRADGDWALVSAPTNAHEILYGVVRRRFDSDWTFVIGATKIEVAGRSQFLVRFGGSSCPLSGPGPLDHGAR